MMTLKLGKPLKPATASSRKFPGFDQMGKLPVSGSSLRSSTVAVLIVSSAAALLGICGGFYVWSLADPFAHHAKPAYTSAGNTLETFISHYGPVPTANDSAATSQPATSQYVQSGQPVMLKGDHNY